MKGLGDRQGHHWQISLQAASAWRITEDASGGYTGGQEFSGLYYVKRPVCLSTVSGSTVKLPVRT